MKKVSVVGRLPLCATLVAGSLLMMMPQAQAQWVKMETEFTPDSKIVIHEDAFGASHPATDPPPITGQSGIARGDAYPIRGSAGSSKLKGSAKTWFLWKPDQRSSNPNAPVPAKLYLLITASANATARDGSTRVATTSSGTSTSTDPRSQPTQYYPHTPGNEKATASIGDKSGSGVAGSDSTSAGVSIRKLVQVSTSGGSNVASPSFGFTANAELSGERADVSPGPSSVPVDGTVQTAATFNAEIDSRSVTLSRGGKNEYTTYEEGVPVVHGDTTYSYTEHLDIPQYRPNYQTIGSTLAGGWSTDAFNTARGRYNVTWNWSQQGDALETGTTAGDHYDHADRIATKGGVDYWTSFKGGGPRWCDAEGNFPAKSPASVTLKYFARDNVDDATAEGRYILTVHEPIELIERRALLKAYSVYSPAYVPNPDNPGQWIPLDVISGPRPAGYTVTINKGEAKSQGYSVGFGGDIEPFGVGIGLNYDHQAGQSWYKEVGVSVPAPVLGPTQRAYLEIEFSYQRLYSTYRRYDTSGEIRRPGSPAVPAPSLPYKSIWDEKADATPSPKWKILEEGQPSPGPKNEIPVYSGDLITES